MKKVLASVVAGISVCLLLATATMAGEKPFDWKRYAGTTINVELALQPWSDFLKPKISEFESLTGIKVNLNVMPEDQTRQKLAIAFTSGRGELDVFGSQRHQEGMKYYQAGWYEPLGKYAKDPQYSSPDFDLSDISAKGIDDATVNGDLIGVSLYTDLELLMYRKDLFAAAGLQPPQNFNELEEAAKKLTDKAKGVYGICLRGKGAATTTIYSGFLSSMGGSWADKNNNPALNTPAALKAFDYYGRLAREYGPPGVVNYHWFQCQNLVSSGKAAMWIDSTVQASALFDVKTSQVADKMSFALFPEGPGGRKPAGGSWYLSIYSKSKHKEAAWYFIAWATGKENSLKAQLHGIPTARISPWLSDAFKKGDQHPDFTKAIVESIKIKDTPSWGSPWISGGEMRDVIGAVVVTAIEGGDIKGAADKAVAQIQSIREKSGEKIVPNK
jgi:multiple sugar transport system substrate-binding protein